MKQAAMLLHLKNKNAKVKSIKRTKCIYDKMIFRTFFNKLNIKSISITTVTVMRQLQIKNKNILCTK